MNTETPDGTRRYPRISLPFAPEMQEMFQAFRSPDVGWDLIVNQNAFIERVLPGAVLFGRIVGYPTCGITGSALFR